MFVYVCVDLCAGVNLMCKIAEILLCEISVAFIATIEQVA